MTETYGAQFYYQTYLTPHIYVVGAQNQKSELFTGYSSVQTFRT